MMLIYSPKLTNRIRYAFELVLTEVLGIDCIFTNDETVFKNSIQPKINYSEFPFGNEIFFRNTKLLLEKGVKKEAIQVFAYEGTKAFFAKDHGSALPFDLFACSFYLATRYEEYLPFKPDLHQRFQAEESIAYKNNFLHLPVINQWAAFLKKILSQHYPELNFPEKKFEFTPTYDIDMAYSYLDKGIVRTLGGYAISLKKLDFKTIYDRTAAILGWKKDPYDTYEWIESIHQKYHLKPLYFFLVGDYGEYDKNISINTHPFQSLIKTIADKAEVGIHPSYYTADDAKKTKMEINRLSAVLKREITKSRQHFMRISIPETYAHLLELDITDDYTMGYASQAGFRAGITTPFHFYNLDLEIKTNLLIHPVIVMDRTLKNYMKLDLKQSMDLVKKLADETKAVNGNFITLFHNETFSEENVWKSWTSFYETVVKEILNK